MAGERFAAGWLVERGLAIERRNVVVDDGEIDIIARDGPTRVAVEVRTVTGPGDPIDAVDWSKRHRVSGLASSVGASRVDFVGIGFRDWGVEVHWVPGSA
ncbi:MAG TPA: YraN family protein [Acidimicrobiia bacterium]|nr:YraN family protein [Acidimicrobiia bacterium]